MSEQQKRSFVDEEIKEKPKSRKLILMRVLWAALYGVVFSLAASAVFLVIGYFSHKAGADDSEDNRRSEQVGTKSHSETTDPEDSSQTETSGSKKKSGENGISLKEYRDLRDSLYAIGTRFKSALVTVTGVVSGRDWFDDQSEVSGQESGVIFRRKNGKCYILTEMKEVQKAQRVTVTFEGGETAEAKVLAMDANTGLAVICVEETAIGEATGGLISVAKFGDSGEVENGDLVLAVGSLQGVNYSVQDGIVTVSGVRRPMIDSMFGIISTDIVCGASASGVLIDLEGRIVGVVRQEYSTMEQKNTLTAFGVEDILPVVEKLAAGTKIPYIGLYVSTVSERVARIHHVPEGVYVKSVITDSPAMRGGIQNGDVLTAINGISLSTAEDYQRIVFGLKKKETCEVTLKRMVGTEYKEISCEVSVSVLK